VGDRQSSSAIATEYASADPVYRVKTQALPAKYAFFRTCRGDGHCGWRGELCGAAP
jgi:ubiquitin thioesterase protein OTUB1